MTSDNATQVGPDEAADPGSYARAILNILGDFGEEKVRLHGMQKAILNLLEDAEGEKTRLDATQKATPWPRTRMPRARAPPTRP